MKKFLITALLPITLMAGSAAFAKDDAESGTNKPAYMQEALSKLPQDKQTLIKKSIEEGRAASKANYEKKQALEKEIHAIFVAPTFDKEAFLAKNKALDAVRAEMKISRVTRIADLATQLSADERKIVADKILHHRSIKHHKGHMKKMMDDKTPMKE